MVKINNSLLDIVKKEKERDIDRYYLTLYYTLGILYFLNKKKFLNCEFVGSEIKLKNSKTELNPDILLQARCNPSGLLGIPVEIKSSLSNSEDILKKLKRMKRYDEPLTGWKTRDKNINNDVIVFSPYAQDCGRVISVLKESLKNKKLNFNKDFIIWEWSFIQGTKHSNEENLLVRQVYGNLEKYNVPELNKIVSEGIVQDINNKELLVKKERNLFTNREPPVEYTMVVLWQIVFPRIFDENQGIVNVEEICTIINDYFTQDLMKSSDGDAYKVNKSWVRKALENFSKIKMAKKIDIDKYEINLEVRIKDLQKHICNKMTFLEVKNGKHNNKIITDKPAPLSGYSKNMKSNKNES